MTRVLLVSNRLPVTLALGAEGERIEPSAGGLVTGLSGPHQRSRGLWIGWPGPLEIDTAEARAALEPRFRELGVIPVYLTAQQIGKFYQSFANGVLWPLFHYLTGQVSLRVEGWEEYCAVNERFADTVVAHYRPGDMIWVHDYQMMLVPGFIRKRLPDARIGFFLHIPFPNMEIFATLPYREELLQGILGADLVGFHTLAYKQHFAGTLVRLLGSEIVDDCFKYAGRRVRLGAFPMGVDAAALARRAEQPAVREHAQRITADSPGCLLVGVDRLDYTKGIPRRLLAFEELLHRHPEWRERVRLIQVAVPSRVSVGSYRNFREEVDGLVGRINGAFGTTNWVPVHYLFRSVSDQELLALYRAADVMLVTPVRDGMNLVAKEFVATRSDDDGVLVLSEFAGAADELTQAVLVNPYDLEDTAEAYHRALTMSRAERRERMRALRVRVFEYDVHAWVADFLRALDPDHSIAEFAAASTDLNAADGVAEFSTPGLAPNALDAWEEIARKMAGRVPVLFLDYDGALTPIVQRPEQAVLSPDMREMLERLARCIQIVLVSGRGREDLLTRVGLPSLIYAGSHGFDISSAAGLRHEVAADYVPLIREAAQALRRETAGIPGVIIEEKRFSVAVHYRLAAHSDAARVVAAVDGVLRSNPRLHKRYGKKVVELGPAVDWHKGEAVAWICEHIATDPTEILPIYIGDDLTDEDAFATIAGRGVSIVVMQSRRPTHAEYSLRNVPEVRLFLERLYERQHGMVGQSA